MVGDTERVYMTDEMVVQVVQGLPNFAGFSLLGLFLYRALMQSIQNNRELASKLIECYRDSAMKAKE